MVMLFIASAVAGAQQNPVAAGPADLTGQAGPAGGGTLHYDLRYAQTARFGGIQGDQQESFVSGDASFTGLSQWLPFSMQYGGGYGWVWSGPPEPGNLFQHLKLSQGIIRRTWKLTASDDVNYTFETPTTGFSGIPGTGEPIGGSGSTTPPALTILTVNTRILNNITTASAAIRLDYATTLNLTGVEEVLRYIDDNGQNMNTLQSNASISRRLNALNSVSVQYDNSRFGYNGVTSTSPSGSPQTISNQSNTVQVMLQRQWNRRISTSGAIGPQWISSSVSAIMPSSTQFTANASATDTFKSGSAGLFYSHRFTGGSGYMLGAESDTVGANYSRGFGRKLTVGVTGSYLRSAGLNSSDAIHAEYGGVQATRALGRYFNVFANYTATNQASSLSNAPNVLNSLSQVIGFGIGYSPREKRFKK